MGRNLPRGEALAASGPFEYLGTMGLPPFLLAVNVPGFVLCPSPQEGGYSKNPPSQPLPLVLDHTRLHTQTGE